MEHLYIIIFLNFLINFKVTLVLHFPNIWRLKTFKKLFIFLKINAIGSSCLHCCNKMVINNIWRYSPHLSKVTKTFYRSLKFVNFERRYLHFLNGRIYQFSYCKILNFICSQFNLNIFRQFFMFCEIYLNKSKDSQDTIHNEILRTKKAIQFFKLTDIEKLSLI